MAEPAGKGESKVTTDSVPVKRLEDDGTVSLLKGEEAQPFAMIDSKGLIWVSAKYVNELAPSSRKSDGGGIGSAMRSLGWTSVHDRRSGSFKRGYVLDPLADIL